MTKAMRSEKIKLTVKARLAGVSQSAVSWGFTAGTSASSTTVKKVGAAVAALGCQPNGLARRSTRVPEGQGSERQGLESQSLKGPPE